ARLFCPPTRVSSTLFGTISFGTTRMTGLVGSRVRWSRAWAGWRRPATPRRTPPLRCGPPRIRKGFDSAARTGVDDGLERGGATAVDVFESAGDLDSHRGWEWAAGS